MFTLTKLIGDNKLPCFIRKKAHLTQNCIKTKAATNANTSSSKPEYEKSLFDSLDLLNEEYLETYGVEEVNSSRTDNSHSSNATTNVFDQTSSSSSSTAAAATSSDNDIVYLCKILTLNCAFARKYESKNVEEYLNSKYGSCNGSIDISNDTIIHNSAYDLTNIKYDDYIIPSNYEGLLEVLPDYSKQVYDTLDHECDVISFASRLKQPQNYYISKPLQLFEIASSSNANNKSIPTKYDEIEDNYDDLIRRWVTFDVGTICLATKVLMVVYPPEKKYEKTVYEKVRDGVLCSNCKRRNKIKFEVAIEFKIVKDFEQLINTMHNDRRKSMHIFNIDLKQIEKLRNENSCTSTSDADNNLDNAEDEKYFYLPIYHDPNETIDLIPIAPTNSLQLNSLQNIYNLMQHDSENTVFEHPMRVRIRVENSFNKLHNLSNISTQSTSSSSFYEIYARKTAKFLVGYNIKREKFILFALSDDDDTDDKKYTYETIEQKLVETIHEKEYLNKVLHVKLNSMLNDFVDTFHYNIHKIEFDHVKPSRAQQQLQQQHTQSANHSKADITDDDGYVSCKNTRIKDQLVMHWRKKNQHFTTLPHSKSTKAKKYPIFNGHLNEAFTSETDGNNMTTSISEDEKQQQRTRSKSLPEADVLKASFTNMSLIIEQDETRKTKV